MKVGIIVVLYFYVLIAACPLCQDEPTEIIVVLDRSGSMEDIRADMIGGLTQFITDQKKCVGLANFTLAQFDTEYKLVHNGINIQDVNSINLVPRGRTALMDAIGKTIKITANRLIKSPKRKVVFVIITDGLENASEKYDKSQILKKIKHMEEKHDWKFVYLGANQDAFAEGGSLGIPFGQILYFDDTNILTSIDCVSTTLTNFRRMAEKFGTGTDDTFVLDPNER